MTGYAVGSLYGVNIPNNAGHKLTAQAPYEVWVSEGKCATGKTRLPLTPARKLHLESETCITLFLAR